MTIRTSALHTSRRGFLKAASASAALLAVGVNARGALAAGAEAAAFNPFVKVAADGTVTVVLKHFEMGQGTTTGLTTLVAEEMDADWDRVAIEFAPADDARYANLAFGSQGTGGSTAMANSYMQYRQAGAAARDLLVRAAAGMWGVEPSAVTVEASVLRAGDRSAHFGEVAARAATLEAPAEPAVKDASAFRLIGMDRLPRKDSAAKTDGTATFAIDVKVPGMVVAVMLRSPKFGGRLARFDASGAEGAPGFVAAHAAPNGAGVFVYGRDTWSAIQARDAVTAEWDFSEAETRSTDAMVADHLALLDAAPQFMGHGGVGFAAAAEAVAGAATVVEGDFTFPFLAHAPMEPLNCVIEPFEGGVRVHDGCQFPAITRPTVAATLGLQPSQVDIRTVYAGGSFGRRAIPSSDYHVEAALAFAALGGATPVKLVWTREDDLAGGWYRPMAAHRVAVGLTEDGRIAGWRHHVAAKSIFKGTALEQWVVRDGVDHASVEGIVDGAYAIQGGGVAVSDFETPVPVLWWRAVGHTHTAYVMETMMDRAAEAAGADPVAFRLAHLDESTDDGRRIAGVIRLAAEKAGWGRDMPEGRALGIAAHKSFNTYVAEVAEVSATDGAVRVEKVTVAVDCGVAVNPDVIRAQMEGGVGYGLGHAMRSAITLTDGEVDQWNFPDYEPLRISGMPAVEVHIVPSDAAPTGVGEPGVPPVAPAVANAIRKATGRVVANLPMTQDGVTFA